MQACVCVSFFFLNLLTPFIRSIGYIIGLSSPSGSAAPFVPLKPAIQSGDGLG